MSVSFLHAIESVVLPVLDLDPVLRPTGLIGPVAMLRDETLQPFDGIGSYLPSVLGRIQIDHLGANFFEGLFPGSFATKLQV